LKVEGGHYCLSIEPLELPPVEASLLLLLLLPLLLPLVVVVVVVVGFWLESLSFCWIGPRSSHQTRALSQGCIQRTRERSG
jgi:hypothetical protein